TKFRRNPGCIPRCEGSGPTMLLLYADGPRGSSLFTHLPREVPRPGLRKADRNGALTAAWERVSTRATTSCCFQLRRTASARRKPRRSRCKERCRAVQWSARRRIDPTLRSTSMKRRDFLKQTAAAGTAALVANAGQTILGAADKAGTKNA